MSLNPPGTAESVFASRVLVVAPHFDDEVLGCGGLVSRLIADGAVVRTLFLSDGSGGETDRQSAAAYSARRRAEARAASEVLGVAGFEELGLPDGRLDKAIDEISSGLEKALLAQRPSLVLVTSPLEVSSDHRAAFTALHRVLSGIRSEDRLEAITRDLEVLLYEVNHPQYADVLVDISEQISVIERAMAEYSSQQERHDYLSAALGLAQFRALTLGPTVRAAEAYRRLSRQDFQTTGANALLTRLGGVPQLIEIDAGPLVSVLVRTKDRPQLLAEALASVAASTYRRVEVVVINDGGRPPELPTMDFAVKQVDLPSNLGRSAAANAGIGAASGEFITFLDDDDVIEVDHLEILTTLVASAGVQIAYTDAAVGVYELSEDSGWELVERRLPYSRDFDPRRLLVDNYIPFNTLLIDRQLALRVGDLDLELEFFEDWDFLIRLSQLAPFHHLAKVTCEYRQFRSGGHHILGSSPQSHPKFLETKARVIAKHQHLWSESNLAEIVDQLRSETVRAEESDRRSRQQIRELEQRFHSLNGRARGFEIQQRVLENELERRDADIERQQRDLAARQTELERVRADLGRSEHAAEERHQALEQRFSEIDRLTKQIESMEQSRAWRVHQWLQGLKGGQGS